ncbi:MAG: quercetin 2,3-dioxygenase, partial [Burkholderiaceae bacterium]
SEFNHSKSEPVHFLQIWITPKFTGVKPNYQEKFFDATEKRGILRLVVSPDGRDGSLSIGQDAYMYAALLDGVERVEVPIAPSRLAYLHVARGKIDLNDQALTTGDGAKIADESLLTLSNGQRAEVLLFDLP